MENKDTYDIKFSLSNEVKAHNNNIHLKNKFILIYLFYNNTEIFYKNKGKNVKTQKKENNANQILSKCKVLIFNEYKSKRNNINIK